MKMKMPKYDVDIGFLDRKDSEMNRSEDGSIERRMVLVKKAIISAGVEVASIYPPEEPPGVVWIQRVHGTSLCVHDKGGGSA